jgi:hypothetical protein
MHAACGANVLLCASCNRATANRAYQGQPAAGTGHLPDAAVHNPRLLACAKGHLSKKLDLDEEEIVNWPV